MANSHEHSNAAQQESVAVWELFEGGWDSIADPEWMETLPVGTKLYTSPPAQRTWVGLTEDEVTLCHSLAVLSKKHDGTDPSFTTLLHQQIEAKLKEKNT